MKLRKLVKSIYFGFGIICLVSLVSSISGDDESQKKTGEVSSTSSQSHTSVEHSRPLIRRRIIRKRIFPGEPNPTNVSITVTVSKSEDEEIVEDLPKPEALSEDGFGNRFRRPLTGKVNRPSFMNRTRAAAAATEKAITEEPLETPSSSFKLKLKTRLPFTKSKPTTTTEDPTTTIKATAPRKPFPVKKLLKRLKSKTSSTTTAEPSTLPQSEEESEEDATAEEVDSPITSPVVSESTTTVTTTTTQSSTTTQIPTSTPSSTTETAPVVESNNKNSSMIIIPVPPSQRKPYHPVIMQVTKTPTTPESFPETKVVTYKLNKMFVPMGIYGKVLPKSASPKEYEVAHQNTIVSTPLPFLLPGQDGKDKPRTDKPEVARTPGPEIKVKGHRSKEVGDSVMSGDSSSDYAKAVQYAASQKEHHMKQQKQWEAMMERLKKKQQRNIADSISLTYDYKPNPAQISLTTEKVNINQISLTTESPLQQFNPPIDDNRRGQQQQQWAGYNNGFHEMVPPRPLKTTYQKPQKTILETITSAASSIPGLIHEGLSTLSGYTQAFEDEAAFPRQPEQTQTAQQSQQVNQYAQQPIPELDSETLEFFRKRPHLLKNRGKKDGFNSPEFSSGFKPVTAPPHFASQYYASTPKSTTPIPPIAYASSTPSPSYSRFNTSNIEKILKRDPLFQESSWNYVTAPTTQRTPKNFLSDEDIAAYRAAILRSNTKTNYEGYKQNEHSRSSSINPTEKSFAAQWMEFNNKYSKHEIDEARDRISNLFSRSSDPSYDDMMYMKPPSQKSGSAFDDLLKMFKMGFSFGAGHSSSNKPIMSYSAGMHNVQHNEESIVGSNSDWVPLTKAGGNKIISLNAGITFGNKPSPTAMYGTHYSTSSRPYSSPSNTKFNDHYTKGNSFYSSLSSGSIGSSNGNSHYSSPNTKGNYPYSQGSRDAFPPVKTSPTPEFLTNIYYKNKKPSDYDISPAISTHFNAEDGRSPFSSYKNEMTPDAIRMAIKPNSSPNNPYSNDPPIEIIPSSIFFKEKGNMKDIAAVIKPPELSDDLVKAALPPQISSVPQLSYPTQQLIQNPNNFKSLSQLQHYFATAQPSPTPSYQHHQNEQVQHHHHQQQTFHHHHHQQPNPSQAPQQHQVQYQHNHQQPNPNQHHQSQHNHQQQNPNQHHQSQQSSQVKVTGDGGLGFSNFELPPGLDPDIASLIKTELDKDDIPEEFRKDFLDQEKEKQKAQESRQRLTMIKPDQSSIKRADKPEIKFHRPIPITPTMLTPIRGKPIRASPVPRYVVELARKLKEDKNVQGIVRVSTKRDKGPPIEYLYPVRG